MMEIRLGNQSLCVTQGSHRQNEWDIWYIYETPTVCRHCPGTQTSCSELWNHAFRYTARNLDPNIDSSRSKPQRFLSSSTLFGKEKKSEKQLLFSCMWRVCGGGAGLPWWLSCKNPPASVGHMGSVPGSGRSPGGGNSNPLQYSYLENPMDRGAWQAVHGVTKSRTWPATKQHQRDFQTWPPRWRASYAREISDEHAEEICVRGKAL